VFSRPTEVSAAAVGKASLVACNGLIMRFRAPLRFVYMHFRAFMRKHRLYRFLRFFYKNWPQILQVSPISDRLFFKMVTKS
jgi:hypothetical protein